MQESKKFWGARLNPGVKPHHLLAFYAAAFFTIMLAVTLNALQPYLLGTFLQIPVREHGAASGQVAFVGELVLVLLLGTWGVLSDRTGRRGIYVLGFLIMAIGYGITPISDSLALLMGTRGVFAIGIAATTAMLATIGADYVVNADRGKATAIMGVMNGLGATTGALVLAKLPGIFANMGQDGIAAGWSTYLVCAGLCLGVAGLLHIGLKGRGGEQAAAEAVPWAQMAREGFRAAKNDIGVSLSYLAAFVARADLAVAGVFLPLWLTKHHVGLLEANVQGSELAAAMDMATAQGVAAGGLLIGIIGGAGLMFAPVIGILCDRINRCTALAIGLGLNVIGYGMTFLVIDPLDSYIKLCAVVIGFGQVGGVISSQVLVQQQAPAACRGSVVGLFGTCGALGIMLTLLVGGYLFDAWTESGPFVLVAALNLIVVALAIGLRKRVQAPMNSDAVAPPAAH